MPHDTIDFEEPHYFNCDCCGSRSTSLTRFVHRDGEAFAVYYARFSDGPSHDFVSVLAAFGPWGTGATPSQRTAFAFRIWTVGDRFQVGLTDPEDDGWDTDFLGNRLSRTDALVHPLKQEAFALSDHIVACDIPVIRFFEERAV